MKANKSALIVFVLLGILYFQLKFVSRMCINIGEIHGESKKLMLLRSSSFMFPLDNQSHYKTGFYLLSKGQQYQSDKILQESIHQFKEAIRIN